MSASNAASEGLEPGHRDSEFGNEIDRMLEGVGSTAHNRTLADAFIQGSGLDAEYSTTAYVAKGSINTIYAADDAALGLRTLLQANNYAENLDRMLLMDMVTAKDPNRAGKRLLDYLKKAGQNPEYDEIPDESRLREFLDEVTERDDLEVLEPHEGELTGLLNSKSRREENSRRYLDEMLPDQDIELNYVSGAAADFNLKEEREKHLKRLARRAEEKLDEIKREKGELASEVNGEWELNEDRIYDALEELRDYFEGLDRDYESAVEMLNQIHNIGFNYIRANSDHGNEHDVREYLAQHEGLELDLLDGGNQRIHEDYAKDIQQFLENDYDSTGEFQRAYEEIKEDWFSTLEGLDTDLSSYEGRLQDLDDTLDKLGLDADNPEFAAWMGHISGVKPLDAKILTWLAADDIEQHIYRSFPERSREGLEISTDMITEFESEELGDVLVYENPQWTNVSSEYALMRVVDEIKRRYREKSSPEDLPDTVLTFHAAGGLESTLLNIAPNPRTKGEEHEWLREPGYDDLEDITKDVRFINMPKFMDMDAITRQFEAGSKDDEAKNKFKSWMQTGMTFQHDISVQTEDGPARLEMIEHVPEAFLTEIGGKTRKLLELGEDSPHAEFMKQDITEHLANPEKYEDKLNRQKPPEKLLLAVADTHVGVPNFREPTNRRKVNAWVRAIKEFFDSDLETGFVAGGDLFDGDVSWGYETPSDGVDASVVRKYIESDLEELMQMDAPDFSYDPLEKFEDIDLENLEDEPEQKKHDVIQQAYYDETLMLEDLEQMTDINQRVLEAYENAVVRWTQNLDKFPLPDSAKQQEVVQNYLMEIEGAINPDWWANVPGNHTKSDMGDQELNLMKNSQDLAWNPEEHPGRNRPKRFNLNSMGSYSAGFGLIKPFEDSEIALYAQHTDKGGKHPVKLSRDLSIAQNTGADLELRCHDHFPTFNIVNGKTIWGPGATLSATIRGEISGYGHNSWPYQSLILKGSSSGRSKGWEAEISVPHETLIKYVDDGVDLGFDELEMEMEGLEQDLASASEYLERRKRMVDARTDLQEEFS